MSGFEIKMGQAEDIPELHQLIVELARFEKAEQEVTTTPEILLRDWQERGAFDFSLARSHDGKLAGMALFYPRYSTWKGHCLYLEDLYVCEAFRGQGLGRTFLSFLKNYALERGLRRIDWQVLDWNLPAINFYENLGAAIEKEWFNCKWYLPSGDENNAG